MHKRLLVANRAEIAVRIMRTTHDMGIETVSVAPVDDADCRHVSMATMKATLPGFGAAAYLDPAAIVSAALGTECDAVHPGYGFLSESPELADACDAAGLTFVGPSAAVLRRLGDKTAALDLARQLHVSVAASSSKLAGPGEATEFVNEHGVTMLKAVGGGGGRGMRVVRPGDDVAAAYERCTSEAASAFGNGGIFAERYVTSARHIEVQIVGDGSGSVTHLWERDCTLQRRHQKIVEFAPALGLDPAVRMALLEASERMAEAVRYRGLATFEFLVGPENEHVFIEVNPRLQVEHTVTEAITGLDLVGLQLDVSSGASLADLGLTTAPETTGQAVQLRVNTEVVGADGSTRPSGGTIERFELPGGPGVRTDTHGRVGYTISPSFDSLLAKVIIHTSGTDSSNLLAKADRALSETHIEGVPTNVAFLRRLLARPEVRGGEVSTTTVEDLAEKLFDPAEAAPASSHAEAHHIVAPLLGTVVTIACAVGDTVEAGCDLLVMEAMKMEHVITARRRGIVREVRVARGDAVAEGTILLHFEEVDTDGPAEVVADEIDLDRIRPDLAESIERHGYGLDENRSDRVERRHDRGKRTARENLDDLVDPGSFIEYGPLVVAAQRKRRSIQELIEQTPGDGLVAGIGNVNGEVFGETSQCVVASYDYMVLAGTQGHQNHRKKDRLFEIAEQLRLPVVFFAEGGGGRPGDTDGVAVAGLDCMAFRLFGELSGHVPLIGINGGYCFAGNAALLGCCDVVIATKDSNVGMGGPAMIEGGGLGVFHPSEIGPIDVQRANGVVDIVVDDEAEAVAVAKRYVSYFQGSLAEWDVVDQRLLRHAIPENRLRIYEVRSVVEQLFDRGSVLELRAGFGLGMITALARIEGRAVGVIANNPSHLAGAIDADGADKASRFMQLCEAFGLPIVMLCDTPGIMVGPDAEATALVRHASRMFVTGGHLTVPICTVVLRKGYGLGAQAMAGGSFKSPIFTVGWPTSEFGGMGLEGFVRLGYRNELAAIDDPEERQRTFEAMVAKMYEVGKGVSMADHFEIDDVIDPADTRRWITTAFRAAPPAGVAGERGGRRFVDTW